MPAENAGHRFGLFQPKAFQPQPERLCPFAQFGLNCGGFREHSAFTLVFQLRLFRLYFQQFGLTVQFAVCRAALALFRQYGTIHTFTLNYAPGKICLRKFQRRGLCPASAASLCQFVPAFGSLQTFV